MWEIKTEAPAEIRASSSPLIPKSPASRFAKVFPKLAGLMDRCVVIRSVVGSTGQHDAYQCMTGWPHDSLKAMAAGRVWAQSLPRCKGRPIRRCRRLWAWPLKRSTCPGPIPGKPGFPAPPMFHSSRRRGMADLKLRNINTEQLADRRKLLPASTRCGATSTPRER